MFVRRLIILFVLISLGAVALVLRLGYLQLAYAGYYRDAAQKFVQRHTIVETSRGSILDRNGVVLAEDRPCFDLGIDYRALNKDDQWVTTQAVARLRLEKIGDRRQRMRRLVELKAEISDQIDAIPAAVAAACRVPVDDILERYEEIRARVAALRQDRWGGAKYDRSVDAHNIAEGLVDPDMQVEVKEEKSVHTLVAHVPDELMFAFDKVMDKYPGLQRVDSKYREYPFGAVGAHVIGALQRVDGETYKKDPFDRPGGAGAAAMGGDDPGDLHGFLPFDDRGGFGIEALAEDELRGSRGMRLVELGGDEIVDKAQAAVAGRNVTTTLDIGVQKELTDAFLDPARDLLKGQDGEDHNVAVVVMAMNGEVLAMVSTPTFDLNTYRDKVNELNHDEVNRPLLNRATASYPPGSIVKPLVATEALMAGVITPTDTVTCNGYLYPNQPHIFRCAIYEEAGIGHGPLTMTQALERSCNIYFYTMGRSLGLERLVNWYGQVGFGQATGVGVFEDRGRLPDLERITDDDDAKRQAIQMGIGQGSMVVTPMQMACAYAMLLRGGVKVQPRLLVDAPMKVTGTIAIPPDDLAVVRRGMELVVNGSEGTARKILRMKLEVAGKTGSATSTRTIVAADGSKTVKEDSDAWFVGYAPADQPRFVIAAVKEFGGHGGTTAAPLVKEAVLSLERHGYLPPLDVR